MKRIFIKKFIEGSYETIHIFKNIISFKIFKKTLLIRQGNLFSFEKTLSINLSNLDHIEYIFNDLNIYL